MYKLAQVDKLTLAGMCSYCILLNRAVTNQSDVTILL